MLRIISALAMIGCLGSASTTLAQPTPANCDVGEIADGPLMLRRPGLPDQLLSAARVTAAGTMQISSGEDDDDAEVYRMVKLTMNDREPDGLFDTVAEIEVNFLLAPGQSLDDRTFRKPAAAEGTPEYEAEERLRGQVVFQAWSVQIPKAGSEYGDYAVDVNHVFYLASAKVAFGKQDGQILPGRLHLCVPGGQVDPFDNPPNSAVEIFGSFEATMK